MMKKKEIVKFLLWLDECHSMRYKENAEKCAEKYINDIGHEALNIEHSYELRMFEGNQIMVNRDLKNLQSEGWKIAGPISVKYSKNNLDRMLIPLKRKV